MEVLMPLFAVFSGAVAPIALAFRATRCERDQQELSLLPLQRRAIKIRTHEHRRTPWLAE